MRKNEKIILRDILESINKIEKYARAMDKEEFLKREETQDAVMRRIEIIGEAVKMLSPGFKEKYPNIPWKQIAGMRDILIHEYFGVNLERVWETIKSNLPQLKEKVSRILNEDT